MLVSHVSIKETAALWNSNSSYLENNCLDFDEIAFLAHVSSKSGAFRLFHTPSPVSIEILMLTRKDFDSCKGKKSTNVDRIKWAYRNCRLTPPRNKIPKSPIKITTHKKMVDVLIHTTGRRAIMVGICNAPIYYLIIFCWV